MPRPDRLEMQLERLAQVARDPTSAEALPALRAALAGRSNHVAARAAQIAGEANLRALAPELVAAFERFMLDPLKTDKGCRAKTAIVAALDDLRADELDLYRRALRHVQPEPVFGGREDSAAELRGRAAIALARSGAPDAVREVLELLVDRETAARTGAVRALAGSGSVAAAPLLRLKVRIGDDEPAVLGECFTALLALESRDAVDFVAGHLSARDDAIAELAALALGGSRLPEALWCRNRSVRGYCLNRSVTVGAREVKAA